MSKPSTGGVLKSVNKYLLQAKKIDPVDPVIGYYCRCYAAQKAYKLKETKQDLDVVDELISWCEKNRQPRGITLTNDEARAKMETFALSIFGAADTEDREGRANQSTAAKFFTAFVLFDCCRQFGELATDVEQKIKYAAWKATDITRALKEGRVPQAGGFDDPIDSLTDFGINQSTSQSSSQFNQPTSSPTQSNPSSSPTQYNPSYSSSQQSQPSSQSDHKPPSASDRYPTHGSANNQPPNQAAGQYPPNQPQQQSFSSLPTSYPPASLPTNSESSDPSMSSMPSAYNPAAFGSPFVEAGNAQPFTNSYNQSSNNQPENPHSFSGSSPSPQDHHRAHPPAFKPAAAAPHRTQARPAPQHNINRGRGSPDPEKSRTETVRETDRLLKHAASALSFDDIRTACEKLETALRMLEPYR